MAMMEWMRENWSILSGIAIASCFLIGSLINHYSVQSEFKYQGQSGAEHRQRLHAADEKLEARVRVNEQKIQQQAETLVRIETQQTAIQTQTTETNRKIDSIDGKLDRVLTTR